jgi:tetratricopeptide (TPR) repeat protein
MRPAVALALVTSLAGAARAGDDAQDRAHAHYEVGRGLYKLGDYRGALREFAAGYELVHEPGFLLNIGQTYRKLGDPENARALYRKFLDEAPATHPSRSQAMLVMRELDEAVQHPAPLRTEPVPPPTFTFTPTTRAVVVPAAAPVTRPDAARSRRRALRIAGITVGVAGLAFLSGGIGASVSANDLAGQLNRLDQTGGMYDPGKLADYDRDRAAAGACFGVGGVMAATSIVLFAVSAR